MSVVAPSWEILWAEYRDSAQRNPAQHYRRQLIHELLEIGDHARLLDAGSGPGDFLAEVEGRYPFAETLGIELSASGIEQAKKITARARFLQRDLSIPANVSEEYLGWATHAVCSEVLEHVTSPETFLRDLRPFLREGARLVITVPSGPMSAFDRFLGHQRHFTARSLRTLLTQAGFNGVEIYRAGFPFFNFYRLLVILRGKKLIKDARGSASSTKLGVVMRLFSFLFRGNLRASPWGWQLVAKCVV